MKEILIKRGDITQERVEGIVNPANSLGIMGGGVALAIKIKGGQEIEKEAMKKAPIPLGSAIFTTAGKLPAKLVIHSPTMLRPAQKIPLENVEKATLAALKLASQLKITSLAFPGMGTGVGGIKEEEAAKIMIKTIKKFFQKEKTSLKKVILIGYEDKLYKEFKKRIEK